VPSKKEIEPKDRASPGGLQDNQQRESPEFPGIIYAAKKRREALHVRGREITSVVCGFSYVREVTMVYPGAIPLCSAGPNASPSSFLSLSFHPLSLSLSLPPPSLTHTHTHTLFLEESFVDETMEEK